MSGGANRLTGFRNIADVEPCDSFVAHLDHRGEVIQDGGDQLADARGRFLVRQYEDRLGAQVLSLAKGHSRYDVEWQRLF